jgi:opacity protein-like surface antigen
MKRLGFVSLLTLTALVGLPSRASADFTIFLGFSPTPESRSAKGFALGVNLLIVGFEFDYSTVREDQPTQAPGLTTGMFNALVLTPTSGFQLYGTAGGGYYRERLFDVTETSFGTNIGGGVKVTLAGPLRLRVDYRVYSLKGSPRYKTPQRVYAGLNLAF